MSTSFRQTDTQRALSDDLKQYVRDIPDFPEPGITFRDITTLLEDPHVFRRTIDLLSEPYANVDKVVVIESRGFIFGTPIAYKLGAGVAPVRKPGKLPFSTYAADYELEYGKNTLEIHQDAVHPGERVLIVDDLLATGGTVEATISLVERLGGEIVGIAMLAELLALNGRSRVRDYPIHSLITY